MAAKEQSEFGSVTPRLKLGIGESVPLSSPRSTAASLDELLSTRRSVRDYTEGPLTLAEVSSLLWAAQGVSGLGGLRTAPSAGAIYPLRTYLLAANVERLTAGLYSYNPDSHGLRLESRGERRKRLAVAALGQECVENCAVAVILTADYRRIVRELGERGRYLAHVEAGHAGQNFLLKATALGLGAIGLGRFEPDIVRELLKLPDAEEVLYVLLAGRV